MSSSLTTATAPPSPSLSRVTASACLFLAVALPAFALYSSLQNPQPLIENLHLAKPLQTQSLTLFQRAALVLLGTIPSLCQAYGFYSVRASFQGFAHRDYFTFPVVKGLRGFAAGLLFSILAAWISTPLLSYLLTIGAGAGTHTITVGIGSEQVIGLIFAGIVWQIAGVMTSAVRIAEENSQFV